MRDLAEAHVLAIKKQEAGGERIIVSEGPFKWQDFGELLALGLQGAIITDWCMCSCPCAFSFH